MAIHLCHVPSPPSSLWTAVGGQEEGAVLFKSQFLSCLGLTESFSPSMGDRGSVWGRADSISPRRRLRECVYDLEQFGAGYYGNSFCLCALKDTVVFLDSGPGSMSSVKSPSLRTEFQRWVGKGAVVLEKRK